MITEATLQAVAQSTYPIQAAMTAVETDLIPDLTVDYDLESDLTASASDISAAALVVTPVAVSADVGLSTSSMTGELVNMIILGATIGEPELVHVQAATTIGVSDITGNMVYEVEEASADMLTRGTVLRGTADERIQTGISYVRGILSQHYNGSSALTVDVSSMSAVARYLYPVLADLNVTEITPVAQLEVSYALASTIDLENESYLIGELIGETEQTSADLSIAETSMQAVGESPELTIGTMPASTSAMGAFLSYTAPEPIQYMIAGGSIMRAVGEDVLVTDIFSDMVIEVTEKTALGATIEVKQAVAAKIAAGLVATGAISLDYYLQGSLPVDGADVGVHAAVDYHLEQNFNIDTTLSGELMPAYHIMANTTVGMSAMSGTASEHQLLEAAVSIAASDITGTVLDTYFAMADITVGASSASVFANETEAMIAEIGIGSTDISGTAAHHHAMESDNALGTSAVSGEIMAAYPLEADMTVDVLSVSGAHHNVAYASSEMTVEAPTIIATGLVASAGVAEMTVGASDVAATGLTAAAGEIAFSIGASAVGGRIKHVTTQDISAAVDFSLGAVTTSGTITLSSEGMGEGQGQGSNSPPPSDDPPPPPTPVNNLAAIAAVGLSTSALDGEAVQLVFNGSDLAAGITALDGQIALTYLMESDMSTSTSALDGEATYVEYTESAIAAGTSDVTGDLVPTYQIEAAVDISTTSVTGDLMPTYTVEADLDIGTSNIEGTVGANYGISIGFPNDPISTASLGNNPGIMGLWSDGTTLWASSYYSGYLYAYVLATGERDSDKDINARGIGLAYNPLGMWGDGTTLYVIEAGAGSRDNQLKAYDLTTSSRNDSLNYPSFDDLDFYAEGVWSNGTTTWVSDPNNDMLKAFNHPAGTRDATKDITLHADNGDPRGIWAIGDIIWVADSTDWKVYAYDLNTGARLEDREFAAPRAHGMWGREGKLLVATWSAGSILSHVWRAADAVAEISVNYAQESDVAISTSELSGTITLTPGD